MAYLGDYDARTALVVVDVQNDFATPDGSLYVHGGEDAVGQVNEEIAAAHEAGAFVVYTQDWHPEVTPHFDTWPVHCVADTHGAGFHPGLVVDGPVVRKGTDGADGYSGFGVRDPHTGVRTPTELDTLLRERGVEHVVVVGLALDYCVRDTALDAARLGFATTVLADATRAVNVAPGDGARAVAALVAGGVAVA